MISVQDLQSLIADIDVCINQVIYPLPWLSIKQATQQRQLLQRVRDYLAILVTKIDPTSANESGLTTDQVETAQAIAQEVFKQIYHFPGDSLDSLPAHLESLTQQRDALALEVQHLEKQRQQIITEFLPVMTSRWAESLTQKIAQLKSDLVTTSNRESTSSNQAAKNQQQLQQLQQNSQQIITSLDATFQSVLGTLQKDLITYQQSLSQGLEEIHDLGQQGEVLFKALVQRWTEQLALVAAQNAEAKLLSKSAATSIDKVRENLPVKVGQIQHINQLQDVTNQLEEELKVSAIEEQIETLWQITCGEDSWQLCSPSEISPLAITSSSSATVNSSANITPSSEPSEVVTTDTNHQPQVDVKIPEPLIIKSPQNLNQFPDLLSDEPAFYPPKMDGTNVSITNKIAKEGIDDVEMITALTDLLGKAYLMADEESKEDYWPENFAPASPKENLLETNDISQNLSQESLLSESQKQALEEDLQNFEQL